MEINRDDITKACFFFTFPTHYAGYWQTAICVQSSSTFLLVSATYEWRTQSFHSHYGKDATIQKHLMTSDVYLPLVVSIHYYLIIHIMA